MVEEDEEGTRRRPLEHTHHDEVSVGQPWKDSQTYPPTGQSHGSSCLVPDVRRPARVPRVRARRGQSGGGGGAGARPECLRAVPLPDP